MKLKQSWLSFLLVFAVAIAAAQEPQLAPQASAFYQQQKWAEAAQAYDKLAQSEPQNGLVWYRFGTALHHLGKYDRAAEALHKAVSSGNNPAALYNLACAYARLNEKEKAFEWLNKLVSTGGPQLRGIKSDEDFAGLRSDARFQTILQQAERIVTPCLAAPEYRQFDFWVGEWDVFNPQGQQVGRNIIQKITDGCIVMENWTDLVGGSGKSMNYYNTATGKWHQKWMGSGGGALDLEGEYKDGALHYTGVTLRRGGQKTFERLTFFNQTDGRVRQLWEQSSDEGKTWRVVFDGLYVRKK